MICRVLFLQNSFGAGEVNLLIEIHARNFLLFREIELVFGKGFNVITGETGAGKSLFVKLLRSLCGDYKSKEMIGPFEEQFWVEGLFSASTETEETLKKADIPLEDTMLIRINGTPERFTARINGSMVSVQVLKEVMAKEMEIHSQNAFQQLKDPLYHTRLLDKAGNSLHLEALEKYSRSFRDYSELLQIQKDLPGNTDEVLRTIDFLSFQIMEIEGAFPIKKDEDLEIANELKVLSNFDFLRNLLGQVYNDLEGTREIPSILSGLSGIFAKLEKISDYESEGKNWLLTVNESLENVSAVSREIFIYLNNFEFDEERLSVVEKRMEILENLKRKYGPDIADILQNYKEFEKRKNELEKKLSVVKNIGNKIEENRKELSNLEEILFRFREKECGQLETGVMRELADLKMDRVIFTHSVAEEKDFTPNGKKLIEFTASTNPGLPALPIAKIASGGELSRIFLSLELSLKEKLPVKTIIFDEIDSGVGARLGDLIGKKIVDLSENGVQTFVITHLPQVALTAEDHFKVFKDQTSLETISNIRKIEGDDREREILEMAGSPLGKSV